MLSSQLEMLNSTKEPLGLLRRDREYDLGSEFGTVGNLNRDWWWW